MATIPEIELSANRLCEEVLLHLAPVPSVLAKLLRNLPDYGGPRNADRDYLRDCIELGIEHLVGACSAWGAGAYFPCEASCRTVFEISVNVLYILQTPDERSYRHQLASVLHQKKQLEEALSLAKQLGRAGYLGEISHSIEMIEGQIEIIQSLAPATLRANRSSIGNWPSMKQRLESIGEELDYPTLYSALCRSTHGDAEPLIERLMARIVAHGMRSRPEGMQALLRHFRLTTRSVSRAMVAQASFRLIKATGLFASRYGLKPLVELVQANLDSVRALDEEAAGEARALREPDAWNTECVPK